MINCIGNFQSQIACKDIRFTFGKSYNLGNSKRHYNLAFSKNNIRPCYSTTSRGPTNVFCEDFYD